MIFWWRTIVAILAAWRTFRVAVARGSVARAGVAWAKIARVAQAVRTPIESGSRVGIEIKNAPIRRHPLDAVARAAVFVGPGLRVREPAGMLRTDIGKDAIE